MAKKYYWLKLKKDFFKRHDIRIIEEMENGKDYILLYLKLLVESIDHEGTLRFSDTIPYDDKMIATITHTDIDKVRSAMKIFKELGFIEFLDDETIHVKQVANMIGVETEWAEKKRLYRDKKRLGQSGGQKEDMSDKSKSKSKSIEKDIKEEEENCEFKEIEFTEKQKNLVDSLCSTFGVNEINQFKNYALIVSSVKYHITQDTYDWFKQQVWFYFLYKKLEKEKTHGLISFMGELTDPESGAWNRENWKKKYEEAKAKEHIDPKANIQPVRTKRLGQSSTLKEIRNK